MYVKACQIYNPGGRALPRHELAMLSTSRAKTGWLVYRQSYDLRSGRMGMQARLLTEDRKDDVFPPLTYAAMLDADNGVMHVRGEETDPLTGKLTAMAWYCEIIDGRWYGEDRRGPLLA